MKYSIDVIPEEDGEGYYTIVPTLPGCFSQGKTVEKALQNTRQAIRLHVRALRKKKLHLPRHGTAVHAVLEVAA